MSILPGDQTASTCYGFINLCPVEEPKDSVNAFTLSLSHSCFCWSQLEHSAPPVGGLNILSKRIMGVNLVKRPVPVLDTLSLGRGDLDPGNTKLKGSCQCIISYKGGQYKAEGMPVIHILEGSSKGVMGKGWFG
jgi:hypothetical protein